MSTDNFIILRKPSSESGDMPAMTSLESASAGPGLTVAVEALDRRDEAEARRDPGIVALAPPMPVQLVKPLASTASDEQVQSAEAAWGITATRAHESKYTGAGITVAVLDTGIDRTHEAFAGVDIIERDFTGAGDGDPDGHGTHCAGTIFGRRPAGGARIGVATGVTRAVIGKVIGGRSGTDAIFRAINWAIDEGAHIVSMSLGIDFPGYVQQMIDRGMPADLATSQALQAYRDNVRLFDELADFVDAQNAFRPQGATILVAASGNESKRNIDPRYELAVSPPANADGILSVGALGQAGGDSGALSVADFSNTGPRVVGPGVDVLSAQTGGGYIAYSGTSMATPHVAGIAALWAEKIIAESGRLRARDLMLRIESSAVKTGLAADTDSYAVGAGLVQAP